MRQIALDTETTGLSTKTGDRIIEIGCVEIIDRVITGRVFHSYCNPARKVGQHTVEITGIKDDFLLDKPKFSEIVDDFLEFIKDAELIIHNAAFDLEFIQYELALLNHEITDLTKKYKIIDTLILARSRYPGQRNNLDALAKRYSINIERKLHGALLDANILAQVVLKMTAGQMNFKFDLTNMVEPNKSITQMNVTNNVDLKLHDNLKVIYANVAELELNDSYLRDI